MLLLSILLLIFIMDTSNKEPIRKLLYFIQIFGVLLIPLFITLIIILIYYRQYIRDNWSYYRTKPYIIPFSTFLSPVGSEIDTQSNFNYSISGIVKSSMRVLLSPVLFVFELIFLIIKQLAGVLNNMRVFTTNTRKNIVGYYSEITNRFENVTATLQFILIKLNDVLGKAGAVGKVSQYLLYVTSMSLEVIINVIGEILRMIIYVLIALSALIFWWYPVLAGLLGVMAGGMGIAYCFDPETFIDMEDNSKKQICLLKIGDKTKGGKINGIIKASSKNIQMYKYKNIIVSGEHLVYETKWLKVKNSKLSSKINYNKEYIFCLITEQNLIYINNTKFLDYEEINDEDTLIEIEKITMNKLNNINYSLIENNFDYNGFYKNTLIKMKNGTYKKIIDISINDETSQGKVISVIQNISGNLYEHNNDKCSGENIIYHQNIWKKIYSIGNLIKTKEIIYNIGTEKGIIETKNNIYRDFTEINDRDTLEKIETIILKKINKIM